MKTAYVWLRDTTEWESRTEYVNAGNYCPASTLPGNYALIIGCPMEPTSGKR